jgi:non-canonical poly(A) RNA polymerase PAPD5/7
VRKVINTADEGKADFLSFNDIDVDKYTKKGGSLKGADSVDDIETRISRKYDRDQYPWISDFTLKVKEASLFLHNEILDFVKFIESTPEDLRIRKQVVNRVKSVVRDCYPEACVMVFGSCATRLNLPNSDIDVLVYLPEVKEGAMINKLTQGLLKAGICKSIDPLKHAKVPIIKLQDRESGVNVDISFNRTNGIYCVKLVKHLLKKYPELRPLLLVLKCFLKSRQLNEPYHGGVGSFLLTMITTSYL